MNALSLAEIAGALGLTKQAVQKRAHKESWRFVRSGNKNKYPLPDLPKPIAERVQIAQLHQSVAALDVPVSTAVVPAAPSSSVVLKTVAPDSLTRTQLDCERARDRLIDFIAAWPGSIAQALDHLNAGKQSGNLPAPLVWAMDNAWDKRRANNRLTPRTYWNWVGTKKTRGRSAPKRIEKDMDVKPWYGLLYALIQRPQGGCLKWVEEEMKKDWDPAWGDTPPSYHAIRRACREKLSTIDQLKGRYTGSQLRSHKHWHPRTAEGMVPWQEIHADGWNTHFTAPHPISGDFVTYEVWHFHDVATRYVPPPGIGLTETYEVITAGLEQCVRTGGIPLILQTDSTKVVKKSPRFSTEPFVSLADRAGFTVVHPKEVGNSQANGICENFNTWLDKQSRELATYQGKGMDSLSLKRVKKITEKMVKAANSGDLAERDRLKRQAERTGKGLVFGSYAEAVEWIIDVHARWNDKPHRSLPKVTDPETGKRRHQTPREAMQEHINAGWQPVALEDDQIIDLFRPHVSCKVTRECISPVGNGQRYKCDGLGAWNGQHVMASIDPMDWRQVIVKTLEGEMIGVADLVTATGYRAKTHYEIAEEKRGKAQLRLNGQKNKHIINTRMSGEIVVKPAREIVIGGRVLGIADLSAISKKAEIQQPQAIQKRNDELPKPTEKVVQLKPRTERPASENFTEWEALDARIRAGEPVSEADAFWHRSYPGSAQYRAEAKRKTA